MRLLIPLAFLLLSCSPNWLCRKCLERGTLVKSDTVKRDSLIFVPVIEFDSIVTILPGDTVKVKDTETGSTTIIYRREATKETPCPDKFNVVTKCVPDTIKVRVTEIVTNEVKTGYDLRHLIGVGLGVIIIMGLALFIVAKAK